jgi:ATP-dependent Lhr-like helicase
VRKTEKTGELVALSASDPLNFVGVLTPQARVAAIQRNRILLQDGLPIAALEGGELRRLAASSLEDAQLRTLLVRRSLRHALRPHLRAPTAREAALLAHKQEPSVLERLSERRH